MWCMLSSPLFFSADFLSITKLEKEILKHNKLIMINQDPLGSQADLVFSVRSCCSCSNTWTFSVIKKSIFKSFGVEAWAKKLTPEWNLPTFAIFIWSRYNGTRHLNIKLTSFGLPNISYYLDVRIAGILLLVCSI